MDWLWTGLAFICGMAIGSLVIAFIYSAHYVRLKDECDLKAQFFEGVLKNASECSTSYKEPETHTPIMSDEERKAHHCRVRKQLRDRIEDGVEDALRQRADDLNAPVGWREELAFKDDDIDITGARVGDRFRHLSKSRHPDNHGTQETYNQLTRARDSALREIENG